MLCQIQRMGSYRTHSLRLMQITNKNAKKTHSVNGPLYYGNTFDNGAWEQLSRLVDVAKETNDTFKCMHADQRWSSECTSCYYWKITLVSPNILLINNWKYTFKGLFTLSNSDFFNVCLLFFDHFWLFFDLYCFHFSFYLMLIGPKFCLGIVFTLVLDQELRQPL